MYSFNRFGEPCFPSSYFNPDVVDDREEVYYIRRVRAVPPPPTQQEDEFTLASTCQPQNQQAVDNLIRGIRSVPATLAPDSLIYSTSSALLTDGRTDAFNSWSGPLPAGERYELPFASDVFEVRLLFRSQNTGGPPRASCTVHLFLSNGDVIPYTLTPLACNNVTAAGFMSVRATPTGPPLGSDVTAVEFIFDTDVGKLGELEVHGRFVTPLPNAGLPPEAPGVLRWTTEDDVLTTPLSDPSGFPAFAPTPILSGASMSSQGNFGQPVQAIIDKDITTWLNPSGGGGVDPYVQINLLNPAPIRRIRIWLIQGQLNGQPIVVPTDSAQARFEQCLFLNDVGGIITQFGDARDIDGAGPSGSNLIINDSELATLRRCTLAYDNGDTLATNVKSIRFTSPGGNPDGEAYLSMWFQVEIE